MDNLKIDVVVIDETLLYICIDGKQEHISVKDARIKYENNKDILDLIDYKLNRYCENSEPLKPMTEVEADILTTNEQNIDSINIDLSAFNNEPLSTASKDDLDNKPLEDFSESSLKNLRDEPLVTPPKDDSNGKPLEDARHSPLVSNAKFASIYDKYNTKIHDVFSKEIPSLSSEVKLEKDEKELE